MIWGSIAGASATASRCFSWGEPVWRGFSALGVEAGILAPTLLYRRAGRPRDLCGHRPIGASVGIHSSELSAREGPCPEVRMRIWKVMLIVGVVAALAGLALAQDEGSSTRGRVQILHMDDHGDRHQRSWVFDGDRGFLGVNLEQDEDGRGARIVTVMEDSAAEAAGLRDGDIITGLNGESIGDPHDLIRAMHGMEAGDDVELEVLRNGNGETFTVELGEHPRSFSFAFGDDEDGTFDFSFDMGNLDEHLAELHERLQDMEFGDLGDLDGAFVMKMDSFGGPNMMRFGHGRPRLGVQVIQPTAELRQHLGSSDDLGILVGKVLPETVAEEAGVMVGDLIVAVDDDEITNAGDLTRALQSRAGKDITLEIVRDGRTVTLEATLAADDDEGEDHHFRAPVQRMHQPLHQATPAQKA